MLRKALVLFSGGQDSTVCLAWARREFEHVVALSVDYGQRHAVELGQAQKIAAYLNVAHQILDMRAFGAFVPSALTCDEIRVSASGGLSHKPSTFVPGRNLVFLTAAASIAAAHGIHDVVAGMSQADYSGYPDCRRETISALKAAIGLGVWESVDDFEIHTPLMDKTKADTVRMAGELGALPLMAMTHTCYEGRRPACGVCPACELRLKGFAEARVKDPLEYAR